jgi:hypothetical protein
VGIRNETINARRSLFQQRHLSEDQNNKHGSSPERPGIFLSVSADVMVEKEGVGEGSDGAPGWAAGMGLPMFGACNSGAAGHCVAPKTTAAGRHHF